MKPFKPLPEHPQRNLSHAHVSLPAVLMLMASACGPAPETPRAPETQASTTPTVQIESTTSVSHTVTLEPVADASVAYATPDRNNGTSTEFVVNPAFDSRSPYPEVAYLRFDLGGLPAGAQVKSVKFQATAYQGFAWGGDGNVYTYLVPDDSWSETGITWNNKPATSGSALGFWWLWYGYDSPAPIQVGINTDPALASAVQAEFQRDRQISFQLSSPGYRTNYRSRESSDSSQHPKLEITYETPDTGTCVDESKPTLVLNGSGDVTLECGVDTWVEPGARAWDACGPVEVHRYDSGSDAYGPGPNVSQVNTYQIQYIAWNKAGYTVDTLRSVHVLDRLAPTLKLKGDATVTHTCGSPWQDPGVEVQDQCSKNLAPLVNKTGDVNSWAQGVYTVRYDVTDSAGNKAPPVTRTVNIVNCPW